MDWAMRLRAAGLGCLVVLACAVGGRADAGVLDRLRQDHTLRIAYRTDAPPFSFLDSSDVPTGFMVNLCRAVGQQLKTQLKLDDLKVDYVLVTAANRFDAITKGEADLLCEPTSETLTRRAEVDFSIATFIDGAGVLVRGNEPTDFHEFAGKKIGVLAGTTTEQEVRNSIAANGMQTEVVLAKTHDEGLSLLDAGQIAAYFADRSILVNLMQRSKSPGDLHLALNYMTLEPYALALPRGDEDFRLAVDRALSHIYRSGEIAKIMQGTFGNAPPSNMLQMLYGITALPD